MTYDGWWWWWLIINDDDDNDYYAGWRWCMMEYVNGGEWWWWIRITEDNFEFWVLTKCEYLQSKECQKRKGQTECIFF